MLLNGVRAGTYARARTAGSDEMGNLMAVSLRESLAEVSDPRNLDDSVDEVFRLMLGIDCKRELEPPEFEEESVTAVVGFGGALSGACVFRSGGSAAMKIATRMTGMDVEEIDDTVKDGIGEICNMLAGSWKGKVPELAANCGLSVPAVITGSNYRLHVQAPEFQLHHIYSFEDARFELTIICDGLR